MIDGYQPVVQHYVWKPQILARNSNFCKIVVIHRIPQHEFVCPSLRINHHMYDKKRKQSIDKSRLYLKGILKYPWTYFKTQNYNPKESVRIWSWLRHQWWWWCHRNPITRLKSRIQSWRWTEFLSFNCSDSFKNVQQ